MTRNPIRKVLSILRSHRVQFLLMGGQACVFYGAAEFSRDTDILFLAETENVRKLSQALDALHAECIAVPSFSTEFLKRGHAVHFRCHHPEAEGIRIDVMSVLRGVAPFEELWKRRTTVETGSGEKYDLLSIPDLVQAKKTQRDKDWPIIRRLTEANYVQHRNDPTPRQINFWLKELRTVPLLIEIARKYPERLTELEAKRPLLAFAKSGDEEALSRSLEEEEKRNREDDEAYWAPLKEELEKLRHNNPTDS